MEKIGPRLVTLVALFAGLPAASWETNSREGRKVVSIAFDPEIQPIPRQELEALLPVKRGEPLEAAKIRAAIERLHATGRYRSVEVRAADQDDGVELTFQTTGNYFIGRLTVEGVSEPPNKGQLANATKLVLGTEFHQEDVQQAEENLKAKLESNGFFEARIQRSLTYEASTQRAFLDFQIDSGPRAKFTDPAIQGLDPRQARDFVNTTRWRRPFGLFGWRYVTETRLQNGLDRGKRTFGKRDYLLGKFTLNSLDYLAASHTAKPDIDVELGPKVKIQAAGAKLSKGRLRQLVPVYQEQSVDRDLLVEGRRNLTEYFQSQGFFRAKVNFEASSEGGASRDIVYQVDRGERYRLVRLEIRGNRYFSNATIRERMGLLPATRIRYRHGRFDEGTLASDLDAIRELYRSNGFRDVKVDSALQDNVGGKAGQLGVTIAIDEGTQWIVARLEVNGVDPSRRSAVDAVINAAEGQPFSEDNLAADRDNVLNYYYNHGFPNANFEWTVTPSVVPKRVELHYRVSEGQQVFVRGVLVTGLKNTDPGLVSRRIRLEEGDPISQARMVESQRRLYDLGIFARVDTAIQNPDGDERSKYLLYQVEEARQYSASFGLGAEVARIGGGTPNFDAPAGSPGFSPRALLGLTRTNFLGRGHTIGAQSRFSNIQQRVLGTYVAPRFRGSENSTLLASLVYDKSRDVRTFEGKRVEGSMQLSQRFSRAITLQTRFTYRRNTVANLAIDPILLPIYSRAVRVGIVSTTLFQDRRDNPIESTRGYYNSIDFGYASKAFASQTDYLRLLGRNSTYHRVARDVIFARSLTFGWINNLRRGEGAAGIPLPERYFSGGASIHRGFPDNQAGPRDFLTGFPLGGSALLMSNLELRFPLFGENLGGVLFHDAGNVYSSLSNLSFRVSQRNPRDFDYMVHAAGFGLRYKTPVGPIRVDLAYGLNSPVFRFQPPSAASEIQQRIQAFQFHFSLGQTF